MGKRKKKVLVVTYYWPPSGGPGVQRVIYFVKYLRDFGWEPIVLTVKDGEYPAKDEGLFRHLPNDLSVYKTRAFEPFTLYKRLMGQEKEHKIDTYILSNKSRSWKDRLMKWIRMNLFIPDARIGWFPFAVKAGVKMIKSSEIDLIYACSPPHTVQVIAGAIARKTQKPWVADFRDPWGDIVFYQGQNRSRLTAYLDRRMEARVFRHAHKIITTCQGLKNHLIAKQAVPADKIAVITNGFVPLDAPRAKSEKNTDEPTCIRIVYAGNLSRVRIPHSLMEAMHRYKNRGEQLPVELVTAGALSTEFTALSADLGLDEWRTHLGYITHQEVIEQYQQADLLLLVVDDVPGNHLFIAGKLFDYLGTQRPILGIGPIDGEVHQIISQTHSGYFIGYADVDAAYEILLEMAAIKKGKKPAPFSFKNIAQYTRRSLTQDLASIFDHLTEQ